VLSKKIEERQKKDTFFDMEQMMLRRIIREPTGEMRTKGAPLCRLAVKKSHVVLYDVHNWVFRCHHYSIFPSLL